METYFYRTSFLEDPKPMKKSHEQQVADVQAKELARAKKMGFSDLETYRKYLAVENRKATYQAKIERYTKAIKEMQEYIDTH